jgi:hypothetical protein
MTRTAFVFNIIARHVMPMVEALECKSDFVFHHTDMQLQVNVNDASHRMLLYNCFYNLYNGDGYGLEFRKIRHVGEAGYVDRSDGLVCGRRIERLLEERDAGVQ